MPNVTNPSTSRQSRSIVADARRRMAARKARSAQTLADHKQARLQHKAHSRALVADAGRRSFDRYVQSRHDAQVERERDAESGHYDGLTELFQQLERRVA